MFHNCSSMDVNLFLRNITHNTQKRSLKSMSSAGAGHMFVYHLHSYVRMKKHSTDGLNKVVHKYDPVLPKAAKAKASDDLTLAELILHILE